MDYQEAERYVLGLTDFERTPGIAYTSSTFDLRRVEDLLARLGDPHRAARTAHVAGTKGKGSTTAMIASVLCASGHCTGLYTSPHFHTLRERINIGGEIISEKEFAHAAEIVRPAVLAVEGQNPGSPLTTFEVLTAIAFVHFARRGVEYQAIEVGLGGRLDATNVVRPDVCVITSISLDHTEVLGKTVEAIAGEKAGIIKAGSTVVCAPQSPGVTEVIAGRCREVGARLLLLGRDVSWEEGPFDCRRQAVRIAGRLATYDVEIPLLGEHQLENACLAVAALEVLAEQGAKVTGESVSFGLATVQWPGRLQVLREQPWLVCDGAHNADSAAKLREALKRHFPFRRPILVLGTSADKDNAGIIRELSALFRDVIVTRSNHPRACSPEVLADELQRHGIAARVSQTASEGVETALAMAEPEDIVCVTGSLFVVGEVLSWAGRRPAS